MQKRATIKDVARHAGVSKSTVSLVLRDSPLIKAETAEKVRDAIKELGYVYNRAAASMRGRTSGLVGLVVNDLRNPFFTEFAISAQMTLSELGYVTVVANTNEDTRIQSNVISSMLEHDISAFIICPAHNSTNADFNRIKNAGIPALQVLRHTGSIDKIFPFFCFNYEVGGRLATHHLLEQGARNILYAGGYEHSNTTRERMSGYLEVLAQNGLVPQVKFGRPTREFGRRIADQLISRQPDIDGVYCFNDLVALGCLEQLRQHNIDVGTRIKIIGFDDIKNSSRAIPSLSSVRCDIERFGCQAASFIGDWLTKGQVPSQIEPWPVELIARETTLGTFKKN